MNAPLSLVKPTNGPVDSAPVPFRSLGEQARRAILLEHAQENHEAFARTLDGWAVEKGLSLRFAVLSEVYGPFDACRLGVDALAVHSSLDLVADRLAIAPNAGGFKLAHALGSSQVRAIGEAVLDADSGFDSAAVCFKLCDVFNSVFLIRDRGTAVGTGILVGDDMVLTAAHVLDACGFKADGTANTAVRARTTFEFKSPQYETSHIAKLAADWLVAWSPACITQSGGGVVSGAMAASLDYALVRLEAAAPMHIRRMAMQSNGRIPPDPLTKPERSRTYFVVGYPAGAESQLSRGTLADISKEAARLMHMCNTVPGMSGGPLLDDQARLIGIHEGRIEEPPGVAKFNRATLLPYISSHVDNARANAARSAPHFESLGHRFTWARYGLSEASTAAAWRCALDEAGLDEEGKWKDGSGDSYYPLFPDNALDAWLEGDELTGEGSVLAIGGGAGTGKTFALEIAKARAGIHASVLVPASVSSDLSLNDMLAYLYPEGNFDDDSRPFDGLMRNTYISTLLDYFESMAASSRSPFALIAVELDEHGSFWNESMQFWHMFALLSAERPQLKVLLSGLSDELADLLRGDGIATLSFVTPAPRQVKSMCERMAAQLDQSQYTVHASARAAQLLDIPTRPGKLDRRLAMADAVRIVLQVRAELRNGALA